MPTIDGHTLQPDHCLACIAFHDTAKLPLEEALTPKSKVAKTGTFASDGLVLDGHKIPYFIAQEAEVRRLTETFSTVTVSFFVDDFTIPENMPQGSTLTVINEIRG